MKTAMLYIAIALVLALLAAQIVHYNIKRTVSPRDFAGGFGGTIIINSQLGLPSGGLMEPTADELGRNPEYRRFVDGAARAAKPHVRQPPEWCEVCVWGPKSRGRGWPFLSRAPTATVLVDLEPSDSNPIGQVVFDVDETGGDPFRPLGVVGNGAFYFVLSLAMIYTMRTFVVEVRRRLSRRRHAFPVVLRDEGGKSDE